MPWGSPASPELQEGAAPAPWTGQASDGLVVLPQPGLQELECQVVSGDDPNDLRGGEKDPSHLPSQTQWGGGAGGNPEQTELAQSVRRAEDRRVLYTDTTS